MTQDPVDRLLEDLDRALSVQPSAAMTAQVRRHIDAHRLPTSPRFGVWTLAAAAVAAVLATSYVGLNRVNVEAPVVQRASVSAAPTSGAATPQSRSTGAAVEPLAASMARTERAERPRPADIHSLPAVRPDPMFDIVISPADRLGLEQFQLAVSSGRITSEMLASASVNLEPTMVIPTILAVHETPLLVGTPPTPPGDRGLDGTDVSRPGGPQLLPGNAPSSFRGSAS
jgi:hypothetical protein